MMTMLNDFLKAMRQALVNPDQLTMIDGSKEQHKVMREMDRNIASNRRLRAAADGVLARLEARDHR